MSGYAQEWVWNHSKVLGIPKYIFLAIARRVFKGKDETGPTPISMIVDITGMSEATVRRSVRALEEAGDLRVVKTDRRGTTHRYMLGLQARLPVDVTDPVESHRSAGPVTPVSVTTETPPISPVTQTTVTAQPDQCHPSEGPLSLVGGTGAYVQDSSKVRTQELSTRKEASNTAAAPRLADEPNDNGNYRVIERVASELLTERSFESEGELIDATKSACAGLHIDYGRQVDRDIVHRACASALFKHRNPWIAGHAVTS